MRKLLRVGGALALVTATAIVVAVFAVVPASSQEKAQSKKPTNTKLDLDQSKFMRKKLEASTQILEGLTTEDADLIVAGAKVLVEMSTAERWQVNNNAMYRQQSQEFQQSAKKLIEAAEKSNFEAVTLKWIDTTMKCMECHTYVRGMRLAGGTR